MRKPVAVVTVYLLGGAVVGVATALAMHAAGRGVRPWLVAVIITVVSTAAGLCLALFREQPVAPSRGGPAQATDSTTTDRYLLELFALERSIETSFTDPAHFDRTVRPLVADLAVERLRERHGIDPSTEPDRARTLLGASLWQLISPPTQQTTPPSGAPGPKGPRPEQVREWVERIRTL